MAVTKRASPSGAARGKVRAALPAEPALLARRLLAWYGRERRRFPWRAKPGTRPDPYRVWLAEIMLQQTTTRTAEPYFTAFLKRWPRLEALAAAPLDEVLHAWQGLGYYARARNLHRCARRLVAEHGGRFPETPEALRRLPGIGPYTAAALAAIAFGAPVVALDGNVKRVLTRLAALDRPAGETGAALAALAGVLAPSKRPGDFLQALMDLGATVCTPRSPACPSCPWSGFCRARALGLAERLPRKAARAERSRRYGVVFWLERPDGAVLLRRRPESGSLGGMMEFPSTEWRGRRGTLAQACRAAPVAARWRKLPGSVRHSFSHFDLELTVLKGRAEGAPLPDGVWCLPDELPRLALPTLMKKVARHARSG